jgi:hypothetical protein
VGWRARLTLAAALAFALSQAGSGAAWAESSAVGSMALGGTARCRFALPEGFTVRGARWQGACEGGHAHGRGLLRQVEGTRVRRVFFGRFEAGQATLGVIDQGDGFVAGRFEGGKPVLDGDRNTLIQAFDEASAAADEAAVAFRKSGNAASARHYEAKGKQLAGQLD